MASIETLRRKLRERKARWDRQRGKYQDNRKTGHLKAMKKHRRAIRKLKRIFRRVLLEQRPSPHFAYSEFDCHDGRQVPKASYPALDHLCQTYLEPLRAEFGAVHVTSGYRPQDYNARIGGASMSIHIYDYPGREQDAVAADVWCDRGTPAEWAAFLEQFDPGGLCPYPSSNFVHNDNRQRIGMPDARWSA